MKRCLYIAAFVIIFIISSSSSYDYFSKQENYKFLQASNVDKIQGIASNENNNYSKSDSENSKSNIVATTNATTTKASISSNINKTVEDRPLFDKEIFLTFDDGPSVNTSKILKILDANKIKATFFVVGSNVDSYPQLVKAEYNDGMCVLNHSYTHEYSMYKSVEACLEDFHKCNNSIKNAIGIEPLHFMRFPGGSDNTLSDSKKMKDIRNAFVSSGMEYIDWNTLSGDADSQVVPVGILEDNSIKQLSGTNFAVMLMHDAPAKTTTVDALPAIIDYLKKQGFIFRTFNDLTSTEKKEMIKQRIINRDVNK